MNQKHVGIKIAQRRKELGLTQAVLAEKLQVTNKAVSKWETGEGYPDITLIKKLANQLELSVDELLEDNEDKVKTSISLGYATKTKSDEDLMAVLKKAEDYMYRRKLLESRSLRSSVVASIKKTLYEKSH